MVENIFDSTDFIDALGRNWALEEAFGLDGVKICADLLQDHSGLVSVLDVGCGPARLKKFLPARYQYHGVDSSPAMIERAAAQGIAATQGTIFNLPWKNHSWDAVVCNAVLFHVVDIPAALEELWRVTRKRLIVSLYWHGGLIHRGPRTAWVEDKEAGKVYPALQNIVPRWMIRRLAAKLYPGKRAFIWRKGMHLAGERVCFMVLER